MWIGAFLLLIWSGYELWVRSDDFRAWTSGVRYMSAAKNESYLENLKLILAAPSMRELMNKMMFLGGSVVFAVVCIILRNRPCADVVLFILDGGLIAAGIGLGMINLSFSLLTQTLKLIPLLAIAAACVTNIIQFFLRRVRHNQEGEQTNQQRTETA